MSWLEDITSSIKYIEGHLTDELTLEKIAAKINLSPFYFQKGFSILCGITDVDEALLDEKGKLCLERADLIVYSHGEYFSLGKQLGTFGYSVRKKATPQRHRKRD